MDRKISLERIKDDKLFDIVVVGGGISGAGIARRAALNGFKTLLLEKKDFSWGTSSRSGKLIHGGLRYIKQGQLNVTYHSVRERENLIADYRRLILPLKFAIPIKEKELLNKLLYKIGLSIYDLFASKKTHKFFFYKEMKDLFPFIRELDGFYMFYDAETDDSGLTFQIIREAVALGALVLNYFKVIKIENLDNVVYKNVVIEDVESKEILEVRAKVVVLATGAWSDNFNSSLKLRKLKGSHIIFAYERFPVKAALALFHPVDRRPLYVLPWNGVTLFGTTDIDFKGNLDSEPRISDFEVDYLFDALSYWFPYLHLCEKDVLATFSGVRSVIDTNKRDPSKENRDYVLKVKNGIITVTGGKLTTFDYIARRVIKEASGFIYGGIKKVKIGKIAPNEFVENLENIVLKYKFMENGNVSCGEMKTLIDIGCVVHLEDLLLRRSRIGLVLEDGGLSFVRKIKPIIKQKLGWDEEKLEFELNSYENLLKRHYRIGLN